MSNFKQQKKQAWEYYKLWMKEGTFCSVLNKQVQISRKGWDHIINGGARKRNTRDKYMRLQLLKPARYVIRRPASQLTYKRNGISYIQLTGRTELGRIKTGIKVILKKDKQGKLYFFSVMKT
jgi:hypothetical protein